VKRANSAIKHVVVQAADYQHLLEIDGIETCYGLSRAVRAFAVIKHGEGFSRWGGNGMGKTRTSLDHGLTPASAGRFRSVAGKWQAAVVQDRAIGASRLVHRGPPDLSPNRTVRARFVAAATQSSHPPILDPRTDSTRCFAARERGCQYGNTMSGGEQQMLEIARALMTNAETDHSGMRGPRVSPPPDRERDWNCLSMLRRAGAVDPGDRQDVRALTRSYATAHHHRARTHGGSGTSGQ